jgi:hypothetical protein
MVAGVVNAHFQRSYPSNLNNVDRNTLLSTPTISPLRGHIATPRTFHQHFR